MKPIARKDNLVIQEMGGEILVYDLLTDRAICLNQTSALVWQNCDGKKNTLEIAGNLEKEFGAPVKEELVRFAITQLEKQELLENKEDFSNGFNGLSRREVVKKIGLTSMIALPIVTSLVAPMAIHAQTCVVNAPGCNPNGSSTCNSGSPLECCSCMCNVVNPTMGNCTS